MYTLIQGLLNNYYRKEEYGVVIIGLDNAGKTTLLERIKTIYLGVKGLNPEQIAPTVGLNLGRILVDKSKNVQLNLWDVGGQKELRSMWVKYYDQCHGILFVIDATDKPRLEECQKEFEKLLGNELVEGVPVLMLANKQDIEGQSLKVEEVKELFNPIALRLGARDSRVLPISALTGEGVKEAVDWLTLRLERNKLDKPPVIR